MRLRNMLEICLVFWKSVPLYAYKHYAYKKHGENICKMEMNIYFFDKTPIPRYELKG